MILSLWNLTEMLPRCMSNFRVIGKVWNQISWLRHFARSYGKTSICLVNRGEGVKKWANRHFVNMTWLVSTHTLYCTGVGLLNQFSPFRYFPHVPLLSKQTLAIEYHVYIWQVSPQLSCGDTCQIWMWFRESNRYFCKIENFAYGEISERSFSNPHPWAGWHRLCSVVCMFIGHMPYSQIHSHGRFHVYSI